MLPRGQTPRMRASRRFGSLLLAFALVTSAAALAPGAVSGAASPAAAQARLQDVARNTGAASTMTFAMETDISFTVRGKRSRGKMIGTGQVDRAAKRSSMTLDMSSFMQAMAASSGQPLPRELQDPAVLTMQVIGIGSKVYLSFPMLNLVTPGSPTKPWVVVDASALGINAGDVAAAQGADPTAGLEYLKGLGSNATEVGPEMVDGVVTTRYRGAISLEQLLASVAPAQRAQARTLFGASPSTPVDVWVDAQGRARRMDVTISMSEPGQSVTMKVSYRFSKFGEPVRISAPPASQVASAAENPAMAAAIEQAAAQRRAAS